MAHQLLTCKTTFDKSQRPLLFSFSGYEALSIPYEFTITVGVDTPCHHEWFERRMIHFTVCNSTGRRNLNGMVDAIEQLASREGGEYVYQLTLRPWIYSLRHHMDCRVFRQQSVLDVCRFWFDYFGIQSVDYTFLRKQYKKISYLVQFNESVYDFLSRLLAEYGIFYYFRFDDAGHTLVLVDGVHGYVNSGASDLLGACLEPDVRDLTVTYCPHPVDVCVVGGGLEMADAVPSSRISASGSLSSFAVMQKYYELGVDDQEVLHARAQVYEARERVYEQRCDFKSNDVTIQPGWLFGVQAEEVMRLVCVRVDYEVENTTAVASVSSLVDGRVRFRVQAIPATTRFVPPACSKPLFAGVHSAVVLNCESGMDHCDVSGRVKVRFHWDRHGLAKAPSSGWVPVVQDWAGTGCGMDFTPGVGNEVLVKYLGGDLDYPLVVGAVYNASNLSPSVGEGHEKVSLIRTRVQSGPADSANALVLDHAPGAQKFVWNGARDLLFEVQGDRVLLAANHVSSMAVGDIIDKVTCGTYFSQAKQSVVLQSGDNSIVLHADGIEIHGEKVTFNCSDGC